MSRNKYTGKQEGRLIGIEISPHDLRRHAATYASRAGAPIEIVSKVILRHANLSTTQRYLGKVSDDEASRWVDTFSADEHGIRGSFIVPRFPH